MFLYRAGGSPNTLKLSADVSASNGAPGDVRWDAAGPAVVDATGLVAFAGAEGTVVITATSAFDASKKDSVRVNVVKNVTGVRTPLSKVYIQRGKSLTLPVVLDDKTAPGVSVSSKLTWKSSNAAALIVSQSGKIKGGMVKKRTRVALTVTAANGEKKTIMVYVAPKATKLKKVSSKFPAKNRMKPGRTYQLNVKLGPVTATGVKVTFKSSKKSVVSVDKAGKIYALKKGKATVTIKAGKKTFKKKITVK
jgi:uncharacterized protein YjdB